MQNDKTISKNQNLLGFLPTQKRYSSFRAKSFGSKNGLVLALLRKSTKFEKRNKTMSFMQKYNLTEIAASGSTLTFDDYKNKIVELIDYNINVIETGSPWNDENRMKKVLTEDKNKTIFAIRFNSRTVVRLAGLSLTNDFMKVKFLKDAKQSILEGEFDPKINEFMQSLQKKQEIRKVESKERRVAKKKATLQALLGETSRLSPIA